MRHGDDGRLMAYLDGELAAGEASSLGAHLGRCGVCTGALERLRTERFVVSTALASMQLDAGPIGPRVRTAVLARLAAPGTRPAGAGARGVRPPRARPDRLPWLRRTAAWGPRSRALQAAALVLLFASGAAALAVPGSPVRQWLTGLRGDPEATPARAPSAGEEAALAESGVRVGPSGGRIRIALELPPGAELLVTFLEGENAALFAGPGTRFEGGEGFLRATAAAGPVRVELPLGLVEVSLEVGGRPYLGVRDGRIELAVPAEERSDTMVTFRIP